MLTDGQVDIVTALVRYASWPFAFLVAVALLRRPLSETLASIGGRLSKLKLWSVTIELAEISEFKPQWIDGSLDFRGLTEENLSSYAAELFANMAEAGDLDFVVVDLGSGTSWLTSRLFVFSLVLEYLRNLRVFVFVYTDGVVDRKYLGLASPEAIRAGLATSEPWLEAAWARSLHNHTKREEGGGIPTETSDTTVNRLLRGPDAIENAKTLSDAFLSNLRSTTAPAHGDTGQWVKLFTEFEQSASWERATWLKAASLTGGGLKSVIERDRSLVDDASWSSENRIDAILKKQGEFVSLLDPYPEGRFSRLVDRYELLARVANAADDSPGR